MDEPAYSIRLAEQDDLPGIAEIYNDAVATTTATFDIEPRNSAEWEAWFRSHTGKWPVIVAAGYGNVLGWASLSRWSVRHGYYGTAELSFYVGSAHRSRGVGRRLAEEINRQGKEGGLHTLLAIIADESEVSIHILSSLGFERTGHLKEVGHKFGRFLDVHILQLIC